MLDAKTTDTSNNRHGKNKCRITLGLVIEIAPSMKKIKKFDPKKILRSVSNAPRSCKYLSLII